MKMTQDLYDSLVSTGGCGFIVNYSLNSLLNLGNSDYADVIFVNAIDPMAALGMAYEVSSSGYLTTVVTNSFNLNKLLELISKLANEFPLVLLVDGKEYVDIENLKVPYCLLDSCCINAAKAATVAVKTSGPVVLLT